MVTEKIRVSANSVINSAPETAPIPNRIVRFITGECPRALFIVLPSLQEHGLHATAA
jgi:hypothetical protein